MPNYSIVANSTFQPFTYQELTVPLDRQELYHEKLAEEYDKLSSQADVLEAMGANDRDKNSLSYGRYKSYSDALKREADELFAHGLNTESRQRLSALRRRYNTDIVPIQNAWQKREKEAEEQMKASLSNPTIMFTRDARNTSLDHYIDNPTGGYGVVNGALITQQMATMAKNLAKQIRSGAARKEDIDAYTYNYIQKYGLDENIVRNWRDSPTLSSMFNQVMQANGVTPEALDGSTNAQHIINQSTNFAEMGMWDAIGEDRNQVLENYGARLAAQEAKEKRVKAYNPTATNPLGTTTAVINPSNIYSTEDAELQASNIKDYSQYFTTDSQGRTKLNAAGIKEYNRVVKAPEMTDSGRFSNSGKVVTAPSAFKRFIDGLGGEEYVRKANYGNVGNLWNQYKNQDFLKYDMKGLTEYNHNIDPSEYSNWEDRIAERAGGRLERVVWDKKNKKWKSDGIVSVSEAFANDAHPVSTQSSIYGRTFRMVDKDKKTVRYRLPRGINTRAEMNIDTHNAALDVVHKIYSQLDKDGMKILTVSEANDLNKATGSNVFRAGSAINYATLQAVNTALENALATFESQLGMTNTNKPQEWGAIPIGGSMSYTSTSDDNE